MLELGKAEHEAVMKYLVMVNEYYYEDGTPLTDEEVDRIDKDELKTKSDSRLSNMKNLSGRRSLARTLGSRQNFNAVVGFGKEKPKLTGPDDA